MSMPAEVLLVRHGRARCNDTGTIAGPGCGGLTTAGREQAVATARRLATGPSIRAVHASITLRAWQTGQIIADALHLDVVAEPELRVPDPGIAEGELWESARTRWPATTDSPTRPAAPGGEPWSAYLDRAGQAWNRLFDTSTPGIVVIVGHSETLGAALHFLLGVESLGRLKLAFDHCAITTWQPAVEWPGMRHPQHRWTLTRYNDTHHLA
ncbi:histidine phosphatase family protein [Actinoplanes couchii]|uniref:Phosphoglycerate mutase n=1 Tax=Actinoplanes couchii TaxID=403638 RepID=A0ABQ3XL76_9ACTN|nr:histidine phosphatase family protein [Actinoplanes couchii]MDR6318375.1 broad specificity phosphatase PhoE [Actinoplanes couchii]GID59258.1 hypothetical protein Aco03nite_076620 [Actinoplanes couchii]